MTLIAAAIALALSTTSQPALVLGETPAGECLAAARSTVVTREDVAVCERAAEDPQLSRSDRTASLVNLGIVLRKRGRLDEAITVYGRAAEAAPDFAEVYLNRSAALVELGRTDDALIDVNRALELGPVMPQVAYFNRSLIYELQDQPQLAYRDLQQALALQPDYAPALRALQRYQVVPAEG